MILNRFLLASLIYVVCWYLYRDPTFEAGIKEAFLADLSVEFSRQMLLNWWDGIWFGLNLISASIVAIPMSFAIRKPETEIEQQWFSWMPLVLVGMIAIFIVGVEVAS